MARFCMRILYVDVGVVHDQNEHLLSSLAKPGVG